MTKAEISKFDRVLLHLNHYSGSGRNEYSMPFATTQDGIGNALGISRSHAATILAKLKQRNMVDSIESHVTGMERRRNCYYLDPAGIEAARRLEVFIEENGIDLDDSRDVVRDSKFRTSNIINARMNLDRAMRSLRDIELTGDPVKLRVAIQTTSEALGFLLKEVE